MTLDTILGIAGTVLGIIGLITGYIFYKKSRRVKEPSYMIKSNNIIKNNIIKMSELNITYKENKIANLTITRILFWNKGAETINQSDIVTTDPLRIESQENIKILDVDIIQVSSPSNQVQIELNTTKKIVNISFDYLDKNQGFVLQVIHNGTSTNEISLKGIIKGASIRDLSTKGNNYWPLLVPISLSVAVGIILNILTSSRFIPSSGNLYDIAVIVLISIAIIISIYFLGLMGARTIFTRKKKPLTFSQTIDEFNSND